MKKFISLLLAFSVLLSLGSVALASEASLEMSQLIEEYAVDTGTYYRYQTMYNGDEWLAVIFIPNSDRDIEFNATMMATEGEELSEVDDGIYTVYLEPSAESDNTDYLSEGFASLDEANVIHVSPIESESVPIVENRRSSAQADLFNAARDIYGDEYVKLIRRVHSYSGVEYVDVYEDMLLRMVEKGTMTFDIGTTLSAISLMLYKATGVSALLSFISMALSIGGEYCETRKEADVYVVDVDFGRWTTVNGEDTVYTITSKIYSHIGIDERGNEERAYLQEDSPLLYYVPSETYYNDTLAQADDAYELYMN